jgi:hypothetical protein
VEVLDAAGLEDDEEDDEDEEEEPDESDDEAPAPVEVPDDVPDAEAAGAVDDFASRESVR